MKNEYKYQYFDSNFLDHFRNFLGISDYLSDSLK